MERAAVIELIKEKRGYIQKVNPPITRPASFQSAEFRAELLDIHPRANGDVRITLTCPYEDRHLVFALTDAWGASLRISVTREADYTPEEADHPVVALRRRPGRQPYLINESE